MDSFKLIVYVFGFSILLISYQLFGQSDSTQPKKYAMQFQIDRDFTLNSFQGSIISLKRNFSNKTALRFGLILNGRIGDTEKKIYLTPGDTILSSRIMDDDFLEIGFLTQFILYARQGNVKMFLGVGPLVDYFSSTRNDELKTRGTSIDYFKRKSWLIGFSFPAGVEWFFMKRMSISAEYGLRIIYEFLDEEMWRTENDPGYTYRIETTESRNFRIDASGVLFGLSIYF